MIRYTRLFYQILRKFRPLQRLLGVRLQQVGLVPVRVERDLLPVNHIIGSIHKYIKDGLKPAKEISR